MKLSKVWYTPAVMAGRPPTKSAPLFGQRLAAARKACGWSQQQFAQMLQVSREMVDYYERRAVNPSLEFVKQAAQVLGVTVTELIGVEPVNPARLKPGPVSQLEQRFERVRRLPRKDQEFVLRFLDTMLEQAERTS